MRLGTWIVGATCLAVAACSVGEPRVSSQRSAGITPLVGQWNLEDNALDTSGQGNNGTITGATFVAGHLNRALRFDGVDDSLNLGSGASLQVGLADAFSTSVWVSTTPNGANHAIIGNTWNGPGWHVRITAADRIRFIFVETPTAFRYVDSTVVLSSGYHHLSTTWDGASDMRIYLDATDVTGALQTSGSLTSITTTSDLLVGTLPGVSVPFAGDIDQIRFYRSALSISEIAALFNELPNSTPVANATAVTTSKNTPVTITLSGTDGDADVLSFAIASPPTNGVLGPITQTSDNTATVDYTPTTGYLGADSFTFTVSDGKSTGPAATVSITVEAAIPRVGLVGEWKLEDNVADTSGNGLDGVNNGAAFVDARINRGLSFDGVNNSVGLGSGSPLMFGLANAFSTSVWLKPTVDSQNHVILGTSWNGPGWHVRITAGNRVRFIQVQDPTTFRFVDSTVTLTSSEWHHLVTTADGAGSLLIFLDGVDVTGSTVTSGSPTSIDSSAAINVGAVPGFNAPFAGALDQLRIYNVVLSSGDIGALFEEGSVNVTPVAPNVFASVAMDTPVTITLSGTDGNNDNLSFAIVGAPTNGTLGPIVPVSPTSATVEYTPVASFVGSDSFTFTASDGAATSSPATASITVSSSSSPLVGQYLFEGDALDTSGTGNNGTANGVTFGSGYIGLGASFDGTSDSVGLGSGASLQFDLGGSYSVSTWINPTLDGGNHPIVGNTWTGPGWHVRITSANRIRFIQVQSPTVFRYIDSTVTLSTGWQHVATTYNGAGVMRIYLNGVDVTGTTQTSGTVTSIASAIELTVGTVAGFNAWYAGGIDQLRLYNAELSSGEVATLAAESASNQAPVANATSATTIKNTTVTISLSGSDLDGDTLAFAATGLPTNGTLGPIVSTGPTTAQVQYTPGTDFVGGDSFTFTVSDGQAISSPASVTITIVEGVPRTGLVGEYLFQDNTTDTSTAGNDGALSGASFVDGLIGRALRFDGLDDSVDLGNDASLQFSLTDAFSLSSWVSSAASGTNQVIAGNSWFGPGWHVRVTSANRVRFILVQDPLTYQFVDSTVTLPSGYHHVAAVYNGTMALYIDGVNVTGTVVTSGTVTSIDTTANMSIGSIAGVNATWNGDLDQVRIYDRALSASEVDLLFSE